MPRSCTIRCLSIGALPAVEGGAWNGFFDELVAEGRAAWCETQAGIPLWIAAEGWPTLRAAMSIAAVVPPIALPAALDADVSADEARMKLVRGRLDISGPTTAGRIAQELGLERNRWSDRARTIGIGGCRPAWAVHGRNAMNWSGASDGCLREFIDGRWTGCVGKCSRRLRRLTSDFCWPIMEWGQSGAFRVAAC